MPNFRNFSCFSKNGRKVTFQTDASIESKSNAEQIIVDGQVVGYSDGVPTSSASINGALAVEGEDSTQVLFDAHTNKERIRMSFGIIDGRILGATMLVETFKIDGKAANGTTVFSCSLIGDGLKKVG
jgi:hypothetical protein